MGVVRHTKAFAEFRTDLQLLQHVPDLGAAAVHHHGMDAHQLEQRDVPGEGGLERLVLHGVPAVLDDDGFAVELAQIGKAFDKNLRLQLCIHVTDSASYRMNRLSSASARTSASWATTCSRSMTSVLPLFSEASNEMSARFFP